MSDISNRILPCLEASGYSYADLSALTGIPKSALQRYCTGATEKIPLDRLGLIADALNVPITRLLGWEIPENIIPVPEMRQIPLIGTIACGQPILADEHIEAYVDVPRNIKADYALTCKGDSMINARIFPGDIVYIRQQEQVENGEIAAVLIDNEATLKRVRLFDDHIVLEPENPQYRPLSYWGEDMNSLRILGKAVAFTSTIR